jgi:hypothetical protein
MKFLVFLTIIVSIWYVTRWFQRANAARMQPPPRGPSPFSAPPRRQAVPLATDTILCARCGIYIPADPPTACARNDCPFPRAG